MSNQLWDKMSIDLGSQKPGTKHTVEFNYLGEGKVIKVASGCSCTTDEYTDRRIKLTYTIPALSPLVNSNQQVAKRPIEVHTAKEDGTIQEHKLTIIVLRDGKL